MIPPRIAQWLPYFKEAGTKWDIDPLLLAAICERESAGGDALSPRGPGGTGDHGHGRGLMQIDDRFWAEWVHTNNWALPSVNIEMGAWLLSEMMLAMRDEVSAVAAYNAGLAAVIKALKKLPKNSTQEQKIAELDRVTTGKNYVSNVLHLRESFKKGTK